MNRVDCKKLLSSIITDLKNNSSYKEIERKYNVQISFFEDYFLFRIEDFFEGNIKGYKKKDYKIQKEIYFHFMEDLSQCWVEIKVYSYKENDFEYITIYEI